MYFVELLLKEKDNIRLSLFEREAVQDYLHTSRELKREQLDSKVATTATRSVYTHVLSPITAL